MTDKELAEHKRKNRERQESTCVHFTGVQNPACEAGVRYADVRKVATREQMRQYPFPFPAVWPCTGGSNAEAIGCTCPHKRLPTSEEVDAEEKRIADLLAAVFAGKSPCCGVALTVTKGEKTQVSHCSACGTSVSRACQMPEWA